MDVVLFSATSLKSLATFHRKYAAVIKPHHTIILIESTGYVGLHALVEARFPDNPVCAISTKAVLRSVPKSLTQDSMLIHSGHVTQTWISPAAMTKYTRNLESVAQAMESGGLDTSVTKDYAQLQWNQFIPMAAFQPLLLMLEAKTPQALVDNILSKPLYTGLMAELMEVASKDTGVHYGDEFLNHVVKEFEASSSLGIATQNLTIEHQDAPELFYNFFHGLPIHVDLMLLQPILLADNYGIKTPYLESMFAFMTQLVGYNGDSSILLARKTAAATANPYANASPSTSSLARERDLDDRERSVSMREKQVEMKEHRLTQWSASLQRMQQAGPGPGPGPGPRHMGGPGPHMGGGPPHMGPPMGSHMGGPPHGSHPRGGPMPPRQSASRAGGTSAMRDGDMMLDTLNFPNRRNKYGAQKLRSSQSAASLKPAHYGPSHGPHGGMYPGPGGMPMSGSRQGMRPLDSDPFGFAGLGKESNRYGPMSKPRSNSVTDGGHSNHSSNTSSTSMMRQKSAPVASAAEDLQPAVPSVPAVPAVPSKQTLPLQPHAAQPAAAAAPASSQAAQAPLPPIPSKINRQPVSSSPYTSKPSTAASSTSSSSTTTPSSSSNALSSTTQSTPSIPSRAVARPAPASSSTSGPPPTPPKPSSYVPGGQASSGSPASSAVSSTSSAVSASTASTEPTAAAANPYLVGENPYAVRNPYSVAAPIK